MLKVERHRLQRVGSLRVRLLYSHEVHVNSIKTAVQERIRVAARLKSVLLMQLLRCFACLATRLVVNNVRAFLLRRSGRLFAIFLRAAPFNAQQVERTFKHLVRIPKRHRKGMLRKTLLCRPRALASGRLQPALERRRQTLHICNLICFRNAFKLIRCLFGRLDKRKLAQTMQRRAKVGRLVVVSREVPQRIRKAVPLFLGSIPKALELR